MAGLALAAAIVCMTLPETHNRPTRESLSPDPKDQTNEKYENRTTKDGEVETPMWRRAKQQQQQPLILFVPRKDRNNYNLYFLKVEGTACPK